MVSRVRPRVVILDTGYDAYGYERETLENAGFQLDAFLGPRHDRQGRIGFAQGAVGLLVRWTEIDGPFLDALPALKYIVRYGVGYDTIDIAAATRRGIKVANVQGYANHSVSDHALALLLACVRALPIGQSHFKEKYNAPAREPIPELHTMTLGIIGLGRIGGALCLKARPLFNRVLACDPYIPDDRFQTLGAVKVDLDTLLAESQAISLHCNLTEETTRLINRAAFGKMHLKPILINTARGAVVDEFALLDALNAGQVHAAGIDVYTQEPPPPELEPLLYHPHVLATGHYAWYSEGACRELQRCATQNMLTFLQGGTPEDCLNP